MNKPSEAGISIRPQGGGMAIKLLGYQIYLPPLRGAYTCLGKKMNKGKR